MLERLIELAEHEIPVTYGSLRNSLDRVTSELTSYRDLTTFKGDSYGTVIRGYINNLYVGIYTIPCEDRYNLEVRKTDNVIIVQIYDYKECGAYYNNKKHCTYAEKLEHNK